MIAELGISPPNVSRFKPWLPSVYRGLAERWKESRSNREKSDARNVVQIQNT